MVFPPALRHLVASLHDGRSRRDLLGLHVSYEAILFLRTYLDPLE
jgi:hypothetical protein